MVWETVALSAIKELLSLLKTEAQNYIVSLKDKRTNKLSKEITKAQRVADETEDDQVRVARLESVKRRQNTLRRLQNFPEGAVTVDETVSIENLKQHHAAINAWAQFVHFRDMGPKKKLGEVYVPLNVYLIPRRVQVSTTEAKNLSDADEVLSGSNSNILVLGGAGAGKTTTLKNYVKSLWPSKTDGEQCQTDLWPILIRFRDNDFSTQSKNHLARVLMDLLKVNVSGIQELGTEDEELEFIDDLYLEIGSKIFGFLNKISATLMLDGFDEMNSTQAKASFIDEISQVAHKCPNIRFILTCRTGELKSPPRGFDEYEISLHDEVQIEKFFEKWVPDVGKNCENKVGNAGEGLLRYSGSPNYEPPQLNWSTTMFKKRRTKDGKQATEARRDCLEVTAS